MKQFDILIIDDEEKFADMLAKRIELRGCTCEVYNDGASALLFVRENADRISLILLDLQLPDRYGTDILKDIRKINPLIPVIVLTGHGSEKDRATCEQLGAWQFIHKPLDIDELMNILKHIKEMPVC